jgi:hypothetical protein
MMKITGAAVFAAALMFLSGCQDQRRELPGPETRDRPATQPASPDDEQLESVLLALPGDVTKTICRKCPEHQAESVLIAELTIPGVISQKKYHLPFKRQFVYDTFGMMIIRPGDGPGRSFACGPGGYHHSTTSIVDSDDSPLTLWIDHSWSYPKVGKGRIDRKIPLILDGALVEGEIQLGHGAFVKISYKRPREH